ncbi:MAG: hypothetical protein KJ645_08380, partial [Planctomycetes bacterium]|nr:hypothetical protein [Planctomycetota bacterium]
WPEEVQYHFWSEKVRDLYFLAMAYKSKGCGSPEASCAGHCARDYFDEAESLYARNYTPFGNFADILKRVREKALRTFNRSEEDKSD